MIDAALVTAILEISNNDKVKKMVEPDLMWHPKIETWMVRRIFKAIELLQGEYERSLDTNNKRKKSRPSHTKTQTDRQ